MSLFRKVSSTTLIMSHVQSIHIPSSIREARIWRKKKRQYFSACESYEQKNTEIRKKWPESTASCTVHADSVEETSEQCVSGRQTCSKEWIKVLSDAIERHHPLQSTPSQLYPEGYQDVNWSNHLRKSIWVTSASEEFLDRIGWRNWVQKLLTSRKLPTNPTKPRSNSQNRATSYDRNKRSVWVLKKSTHVSHLAARVPICLLNVWMKTKTPTKTWTQMESERSDQLVYTGLSSSKRQTLTSGCLDCHMQLWNKPKILVFSNSWRRSKVNLIDKIFKPVCNKVMLTTHLEIKEDDSWHGQWRAIRVMRNNSHSAMLRMLSLRESRNYLLNLWTSLERNWNQPTFSSMAVRRFLNRELRHQEGATSRCSARKNWSTERAFKPTMLEGDVSKKKYEGIHDRFLKDSTYRAPQLKIGWTEETCIAMEKLAQENQSYCPLPEEFERYRKNGISHAPMKLRSDFSEAATKMHRLHRKSGEERLAPMPFYRYQKWHSLSSSSSTSWWQWNDHLRSS